MCTRSKNFSKLTTGLEGTWIFQTRLFNVLQCINDLIICERMLPRDVVASANRLIVA